MIRPTASLTESKKSHEELASNYALQVALQTMKERCQQLQARLSVVEEENLQLKIDKQRHMRQENKSNASNACDVDKLQEQIAQLSRQKSQLTHHIYMVATENKHLWTKLSLLTEANESIGTRLNKISTALSNHTNNSEQFLHEINNDIGNQSLEEISLKLISNVQQEKSQLEKQCAEMVELQSIKDCDFVLTSAQYDHKSSDNTNEEYDEEDSSNELLSDDLKYCRQQLAKFLVIVKNQKLKLQNTLNLLKAYSEGKDTCRVCKTHMENTKKAFRDVEVMTSPGDIEKDSIDEEVRNITENSKLHVSCYCKMKSKQRVCPMCGCIYYNTDTEEFMNEFVDHVRSHFPPIDIKNDDFDQFYHEQPPSVL